MHRYAPDFELEIDGTPIPPALRGSITGITYQNGLEGADRVEVSIANADLRWLDDPLLQIDAPLRLWLGYADAPLTEMFVGEITGIDASFPNGGMPTLTVVAHDFLQRLTQGAKDRAFALSIPGIGKFPLPDPAIAALVSGVNLLVPVIDPAGAALSFLTLLLSYAIDPIEARRAIRIQESESDFEFLSKLARDNGWEMYIDHTLEPRGYMLRFQFLIQDYTPTVNLKWGESLLDFTPRITTVGQVVGVTTRIWLSSIKMEIVVVLAWDYDRAAFDLQIYPGLGSLEVLAGGKEQGLLKINATGPATAPKEILSTLLPKLNNRLTSSGSTLGNPEIRAGRVISFDGLGEQFSGLYRVTNATHTLDSGGYRTQFNVRKEVWFGSVPVPKGASGLLRVQGQTVG